MNSLKIKVCGMRDAKNIASLNQLDVDFMGMIFYEKSPRYVNTKTTDCKLLVANSVKRIGVFVKEELGQVSEIAKKYNLDYVQLHGGEELAYCKQLKVKGIKIIKVFAVDEAFDFDKTIPFETVADYFLFDTKGEAHGGNGIAFDWGVLKKYKGAIPFFLGGGIGPTSIDAIKELNHPMLFSLDLNSKFEIEPGLKNIVKLKDFIQKIKN